MSGRNSVQKRAKKTTLAKRRGLRCAYCNKLLTMKSATLDHYMPLCLGGTWSNENLRLCCRTCNQKKGCQHPLEWANRKRELRL